MFYMFEKEVDERHGEEEEEEEECKIDVDKRSNCWHDIKVCRVFTEQTVYYLRILILDPRSNSRD